MCEEQYKVRKEGRILTNRRVQLNPQKRSRRLAVDSDEDFEIGNERHRKRSHVKRPINQHRHL